MSGEALKWALDQEGSGPAMQALLLVLGLSATSPSQLCELSRADLARRTRQSQRNVTRLLAELEELGVVERDDRYSGDGGREIIARLRIDRTVRLPTREERRELQQLMCMHGYTKCRPIAFYVNAERSESFDRELWLVVCARRTRGFLRRHWAMLAYVLALAAGVLASTHWAAP